MNRLLFSITLLAFTTVQAVNAFDIEPVMAEVNASAPRPQVFTLSNNSDSPKPIAIQLLQTTFDREGNETLTPADAGDFIILPRQLTLPAQSRRSVRVQYVGPNVEIEQAYRIAFEELPVDLEDEAEASSDGDVSVGVKLLITHNVRVWVTPNGAEPQAAIQSIQRQGGIVAVLVQNDGKRRFMLRKPQVRVRFEGGRSLELSDQLADTLRYRPVLAESQRYLFFRLPEDAPVGINVVDLDIRERS